MYLINDFDINATLDKEHNVIYKIINAKKGNKQINDLVSRRQIIFNRKKTTTINRN